jgi:hypothetical protein
MSKPTKVVPSVAGSFAVIFEDMALSMHLSEPSAKRYQSDFENNLLTYLEGEHADLVLVWGWIRKHNGRMGPYEIHLIGDWPTLHRFETVEEAARWIRDNQPPQAGKEQP